MFGAIKRLTVLCCAIALFGCVSQNMSSQVKFQDVGSIPPPRNGPVYVGLIGQAKQLETSVNSSTHLTTIPPHANAAPVFYIDATQRTYERRQDAFVWIPVFVATIIPISGITNQEWEIAIKSEQERYPSRYTYTFKRKWYLSFFPHVYLFGKYANFGETSQVAPPAIEESEKAHVVSNIIYEANLRGLLNTNK
ncbi:hypothetical protein [Zhongshania arctica]|uniref:Lipoprotein n=1 Tax=Zhongshania arctica TaxID=3238302 RepID=A0ABV3TQY1_9GAMM